MKYIDTTEALQKARETGVDISLVTLIGWCKPLDQGGFEIGKKIGGRWYVIPNRLKLMLEGKQDGIQKKTED